MSDIEKWIVEIIAVPYGIRLLVDRATSPLKRPMRKLRQVEKADAGGGVWRRTRHNSCRPHHRHLQQHLRRRLQAGKCPERQDLSKNFLSLRPSYQFEFECVLNLWLIWKAPIFIWQKPTYMYDVLVHIIKSDQSGCNIFFCNRITKEIKPGMVRGLW